ncbi:type II toxin-antitoxin system HicB family antitoxin [Mycetohabitans rhizoxinica]|uniref:type II toxin-antitoxin system HicB family antitoxin n=1 Tax=Mycetohabitans rhizoxinica TaxID=412963 RepID=UPI0030CD974F
MLYPLYVHVGDAKHAHGVTFPDFPGCFAAADNWTELPVAVQEAVEAHFGDDEGSIPEPSPLEALTQHPEYKGGVWMLFDIDLSKINAKAVRLNISLPERLVQKIDSAAQERKLSRSAFLALAAEHEMQNGERQSMHR